MKIPALMNFQFVLNWKFRKWLGLMGQEDLLMLNWLVLATIKLFLYLIGDWTIQLELKGQNCVKGRRGKEFIEMIQ